MANPWDNDQIVNVQPVAPPRPQVNMPPASIPGRGPKPAAQLDPQLDQANISRIYSDIASERERLQLAQDEAARKAQKDALELQAAQEKERRAAISRDALSDAEPIFRSIEQSQDKLGWNTTGLGGWLFSFIPGTESRQLQAAMDPIKSNLTFSALQKMRESSPTGGAVGNASDADMKLLGSTVASLDPTSKTPEQLRDDLDFIGKRYVSLLRRWGYSDDQIRLLNPMENLFGPPTGQRTERAREGTKTVPLSEGQQTTLRRVGNLISSGASDDEIKAAMAQGFPEGYDSPSLDIVLSQRTDPNSPVSQWLAANPGKPYPYVPEQDVPTTGFEEGVSGFVDSPLGAFTVGATSPGLSAAGAGAFLTGNQEEADLLARGMRESAEENPGMNLLGSFAGGLFLPGGASLNLGRQVGLGAGLGAIEGFGGSEGGIGERMGGAFTGAAFGGGAVPVVRGAGTIGGTIASDFNRAVRGADYSTSAALRDLGLTPQMMQQRAAEFQQRTGRGPRLVDLLLPEEANRLTDIITRSPDAATMIGRAAKDESLVLPERLAAATRQSGDELVSPQTLASRVTDEADQAFDAMRATPLTLAEGDRTWLKNVVADEVAPKSRGMRTEFEAVLKGEAPLTVGMLDNLRRRLRALASTNPGEGYQEIANDLEELAAKQVPELRTALDNFRSGMEMVEGAQAGRAATGRGANAGLIDFNATLANAFRSTRPGTTTGSSFRAGAQQGARSGIFQDALESPAGAYRLAANLAESPATRERLMATLGPEEAARVIQAAEVHKQSIDSFMALARVPADKIPATLNNAGEIAQAIAVAGQGGSSFAVAHLVRNLKDTIGVGQDTAERLAQRLLDPKTTNEAVGQLKKAKLNRQSVTRMLQNALFYTAQNIAGRTAAGTGPAE